MNLSALNKIRCRFLDQSTGMPVPGVIASLSVGMGSATKSARLPVGTLCTDATGYMSFDLKPVNLEVTPAFGLFISAPEFGLANHDLLRSLVVAPDEPVKDKDGTPGGSQTSFIGAAMMNAAASNGEKKELPCIVFPVYLGKRPANGHGSERAGCEVARLPSIQSPDVADYKVSPFSFVTPAALRLGNDCCESLLPSSLPTQRYRFNKVVVRRDETVLDGNGFADDPSLKREVRVFDGLESRAPMIKFGEILEYRQDWYSLGHALGEIKYSLPLAPGESTQLAVIEWSRDDIASRTDDVRATEFLDHDARRDRAIDRIRGYRAARGTRGKFLGVGYDRNGVGQYLRHRNVDRQSCHRRWNQLFVREPRRRRGVVAGSARPRAPGELFRAQP